MRLAITEEQTFIVTGVSNKEELATSLANQLVGKTSHAAIRFLGREFFIIVSCLKALGNKRFEIEGRITVEFVRENEEPLAQPTGFRGTIQFLTEDHDDCTPSVSDELKPTAGSIVAFPMA